MLAAEGPRNGEFSDGKDPRVDGAPRIGSRRANTSPACRGDVTGGGGSSVGDDDAYRFLGHP